MQKKIWLSSPHMGGREMAYIQAAFDENWIAPLGPNVDGFEKDLETFLGEGSHAAALSSGTAALHLALLLLGVGPEDEVICQSLTFSASANVVRYVGASPIFIDSELSTWNLCPNVLEEAIKDRMAHGKKPKAIITVSLYGMPYMIDEVHEVAARYGIPIIEDSAESLGSTYKGRKMGTFGEISVISFNGNKIITTSGGGALISRNPDFVKSAIHLATQAKEDAPHYEHTTIGYNYRMSNVSAGIGRGQMEVLAQRITQKREIHTFYSNLIEDFASVEIFSEHDDSYYSNHWLNAVIIDDKAGTKNREGLRMKFLEQNIESRPLWKPMHLQPVFRSEVYYGGNHAERLFDRGLCLPSGSNLNAEDKERIKKLITAYFT